MLTMRMVHGLIFHTESRLTALAPPVHPPAVPLVPLPREIFYFVAELDAKTVFTVVLISVTTSIIVGARFSPII